MKNAPLRHALEYALFLPFHGLVKVLPHGANRRLGAALGSLAHAFDGRRRAIARDSLAQAFPAWSRAAVGRTTRACFRHFGASFIDALSARRFDLVELCRRVTAVGLDRFAAAEAGGRGVIVLSAHFGNWEIVPPFVALARGPMASVGRAPDNPHFAPLLDDLRTRFGNRALDKRGAVREMFRVLRQGGRLGLLIDQRVRASEAIDVPFFGRPAWTSPIVARLALKTGAAILPVVGDHLPGGRYRIEFLEPIHPAGGDDEANSFALTLACLERCEAVIRTAPERWLWLHNRWQH